MLFLINLLVTLLNKLGLYTKWQINEVNNAFDNYTIKMLRHTSARAQEMRELEQKYRSLSNRYNDLLGSHHDQTIEISKLKDGSM